MIFSFEAIQSAFCAYACVLPKKVGFLPKNVLFVGLPNKAFTITFFNKT